MGKELLSYAVACHMAGIERMSIWTPQGWKAPKGFPRRSLLCKPTQGGSTWDVSTEKLLKFLAASV